MYIGTSRRSIVATETSAGGGAGGAFLASSHAATGAIASMVNQIDFNTRTPR